MPPVFIRLTPFPHISRPATSDPLPRHVRRHPQPITRRHPDRVTRGQAFPTPARRVVTLSSLPSPGQRAPATPAPLAPADAPRSGWCGEPHPTPGPAGSENHQTPADRTARCLNAPECRQPHRRNTDVIPTRYRRAVWGRFRGINLVIRPLQPAATRGPWWRGGDSNPRPRDYESRALTG